MFLNIFRKLSRNLIVQDCLEVVIKTQIDIFQFLFIPVKFFLHITSITFFLNNKRINTE